MVLMINLALNIQYALSMKSSQLGGHLKTEDPEYECKHLTHAISSTLQDLEAV